MRKIVFRTGEKKIINDSHFSYPDDSFITINFGGKLTAGNVNEDAINEIRKTLELTLGTSRTTRDLKDTVKIIKNIFRNYDEQHLEVSQGKNNTILNSVFYEKGNLIKYYHILKVGDNAIEFNYSKDKEIAIFNPENSRVTCRYKDYSQMLKDLKAEFDNLNYLATIKPKNKLTNNEKVICKAYEMFYNEIPDFRGKENMLKTQAMTFLLNEFGINMGDDYRFNFTLGFPYSFTLSETIINLMDLGQIEQPMYQDIKFSTHATRKIKAISETINPHDKNSETLKTLTSVLYAQEYLLDRNSSYGDIAKRINSSEEDVQKSLNLTRNLVSATAKK